MEKPNCYRCKHRGDLPGNSHSCCGHPSNSAIMNDSLPQMMGMFASIGRVSLIVVENELNIRGNAHGIKNGWFNWPLNFDPMWLEQCNGFEREEVNQDANKMA